MEDVSFLLVNNPGKQETEALGKIYNIYCHHCPSREDRSPVGSTPKEVKRKVTR